MIAVLAFLAFAKEGSLGLLFGAAAVALIYLVIGAVVWFGRRRPE